MKVFFFHIIYEMYDLCSHFYFVNTAKVINQPSAFHNPINFQMIKSTFLFTEYLVLFRNMSHYITKVCFRHFMFTVNRAVKMLYTDTSFSFLHTPLHCLTCEYITSEYEMDREIEAESEQEM